MTDAPETIWANKEFGCDDWDAGTFCTVDDGSTSYTRTDHSQALIAAAYEAAGKYLNEQSKLYPDNVAWAVRDDGAEILGFAPDDANAALDRLIADAERRGMERAAELVEPKTPRSDWTEYARISAVKARLIRAAMEDKP
jgi:hypothetical protein